MTRRLLLAAVLTVLFTVNPWPADGHLVRHPDAPTLNQLENRERSQQRNLHHARYVCERGRRANRRWHCAAAVWIARELRQTRAQLGRPIVHPRIATTGDACLDEIIDRETVGTWDHTIWNYQGSGAYGLPQALPARKMASAGADYMTNPLTQVRWMRGYVNGRYGGSCAALSFHNRNGWY